MQSRWMCDSIARGIIYYDSTKPVTHNSWERERKNQCSKTLSCPQIYSSSIEVCVANLPHPRHWECPGEAYLAATTRCHLSLWFKTTNPTTMSPSSPSMRQRWKVTSIPHSRLRNPSNWISKMRSKYSISRMNSPRIWMAILTAAKTQLAAVTPIPLSFNHRSSRSLANSQRLSNNSNRGSIDMIPRRIIWRYFSS